MSYAVGCVPYLNAKPLVWPLVGDDSPVKVSFDVPSQLPHLLDGGDVQAILVSSIEALRRPGARVADRVSISTNGEVLSVRLFSKRPLDQIETLALDQSSMTSNALARILLAEKFGCLPATRSLPPDLDTMLDQCDAGILIGDAGMRANGSGLHVLDLGAAWTDLTGLPFVWALWVGEASLDTSLAGYLADAPRKTLSSIDSLVGLFANEAGFPQSLTRHYITEVMDYGLGESHRRGLAAFADRLVSHGLSDSATMPEFVAGHALVEGARG